MDLRPVQTSQDAAEIRRERRENLRTLSSHTHQADGGLRVGAHLGAVDGADGVDLGLPSC